MRPTWTTVMPFRRPFLRAAVALPCALTALTLPSSAFAQGTVLPASGGARSAEDGSNAPTPGAEPSTTPTTPRTIEPPKEAWDATDVEELPGKSYLFVGARYRGNVIPQFMLNLFVDEGATIYSNTIGIELDRRKDGFSIVSALGFTEYGTGDILFKQAGSRDIPGNYSVVNSSMKAIYATVDLLWSAKISRTLVFEYGAGFGLGAVFGGLSDDWVYRDPNGPLKGSSGNFSKCATEGQGGPGSGCNKAEHQNADVAKVSDYMEKSWFNGGSKPVLFPWISIPQVGLRYNPIKAFEARLGLGFSLTGFWFGLSGDYGLERKPAR